MLTCKQVSKSLAEQDYECLTWGKKVALKVHVALCFVCGRYNRQMMDLHDGIRGFKAFEEDDSPVVHREGLSEEQRTRLKETVSADASR